MKKKSSSQDNKLKVVKEEGNDLFSRVVSILDQARGNVVRAVNNNMIVAYWLIGREIVIELQSGDERAEYGKQVLENLSNRLKRQYGDGFSVANLKNFRQFYLTYPNRLYSIRHLAGGELTQQDKKRYPAGSESANGFSPQLSWSHYRALMRVQDEMARGFYEKEAVECGWSKAQLARQIQTSYYQRILANRGEAGLIESARERLPGEPVPAAKMIKSPYVLEFLGLPDTPGLHENTLEQAIIDNLQNFLLELGKGFSFVARQKHIRFDDEDFYIDLVFYNFILKCFLLVDLKIGKLNHRDIGQMDGYVRLFEDSFKVPGDNPTIGLILCSDKGEAVAKYSVLNEGKQIFASKYLHILPSEEDLKHEIENERLLLEEGYLEEQQAAVSAKKLTPDKLEPGTGISEVSQNIKRPKKPINKGLGR
jgi:predicted nuclease of restriction endonuclease-like (RecB) superfamily